MKFKQLSTGTVLEVKDETVIAMMTASSAYAVVEQPKAKTDKGGKNGKGKSAEDTTAAE